MTIERAAQLLGSELRLHCGERMPWSVGVGDDVIFVYGHGRKKDKPPIDLSKGWHGFSVEVKHVGKLRPL